MEADDNFWLTKEGEIADDLVDLADFGFVIEHECFALKYTDDTRCLSRRGVAEALVKAKTFLPAGYNFKISDGWRPWAIQEKSSADTAKELQNAHPDWDEEKIDEQLVLLCPPQRIVRSFASHRYGGSLDLTIVDQSGNELDMGSPVSDVSTEKAGLLYYELGHEVAGQESVFQKNRRLLIHVMSSANFQPYLHEFWHWDYTDDVGG